MRLRTEGEVAPHDITRPTPVFRLCSCARARTQSWEKPSRGSCTRVPLYGNVAGLRISGRSSGAAFHMQMEEQLWRERGVTLARDTVGAVKRAKQGADLNEKLQAVKPVAVFAWTHVPVAHMHTNPIFSVIQRPLRLPATGQLAVALWAKIYRIWVAVPIAASECGAAADSFGEHHGVCFSNR